MNEKRKGCSEQDLTTLQLMLKLSFFITATGRYKLNDCRTDLLYLKYIFMSHITYVQTLLSADTQS